MVIRRAEHKDVDAVFRLAKDFAISFVVDERAFRTTFTQLLIEPDAFLAVAVVEEHIIGYILGFNHKTFFANGRVGWVEEIMVKEECRQQGIGKRLMQSMEAWASAQGCKLVALATRRAADFYHGLGYQESATYFRKQGLRRTGGQTRISLASNGASKTW
jgi:N-acetylglutamate synthase-like GNAT family acetyltransferase